MRESAARIATIFPMERLTAWERLRRVKPLIWDVLLALFVFGFSLLSFLFLLQMVPATVSVIYLWMKLRGRSAPAPTQEQASEGLTAA
jgi:uncharacterized membrane protein